MGPAAPPPAAAAGDRVGVERRRTPPAAAEAVTTFEDVCYFRALVACLEAGGESLWDLPCACLALAAVERRWAGLVAGGEVPPV